MVVGILESPASLPDTVGLPEYRVTEVFTEIDGRDVRVAFGTKRFGHVEWLYTTVVSPDKLFQICRHCEGVAAELMSLIRLMSGTERSH